MFCRIVFLKREENPKPCEIAACYGSDRDLAEIEEFAWREARRYGADGFRLRDLHTDEVKVVWD